MCHIPTSMSKAQAEWNPALLAARWGTLCQRMLDVLNTVINVTPISGRCLQRNHGQLRQSLGVIFAGRQCKGMLYSQFLEEFRVAPRFPMLSPGSLSSALLHLCPWASPFPLCDTSCAARNSSGSRAVLSHFFVSVQTRQGRIETWKMSCIPEKGRGFGSSSTAGCLHKQIPRLLVPFHV